MFNECFSCVNRVLSPTRNASNLDQIWISEALVKSYPLAAEVGPPLSSSDYRSVFLSPTSIKQHTSSVRKTVYDYRRSFVTNFLSHLSQSKFSRVYEKEDVNGKCSEFYSIFYNAMSCIPRREVTISTTDNLDYSHSKSHDRRPLERLPSKKLGSF